MTNVLGMCSDAGETATSLGIVETRPTFGLDFASFDETRLTTSFNKTRLTTNLDVKRPMATGLVGLVKTFQNNSENGSLNG